MRERRLGIAVMRGCRLLQFQRSRLNSLVPSAVEEFVAKPRFDHQDRAAAAAGEVVGSVARVLLNSSEAARLAARAPPPGSYTLPSFFDDVDRQRQAGHVRCF